MSVQSEWLTVFEVIERTGVPYRVLIDLTEHGELVTRSSGSTVLYAEEDVARLESSDETWPVEPVPSPPGDARARRRARLAAARRV